MANEISNANAPSVEDSDGNPVEDATIIAVKQEDVAALSQSQATEIQALAKLTDVNGDFTFSESELYVDQNQYVVVALEESGEQRGTPNYPHVDASGSTIPDALVDDFERGDLSPYSGNTSEIVITTSNVLENQYSIENNDKFADRDIIYSNQGDGLEYYPQKGDIFSVLLRDVSDSSTAALPCFSFGLSVTSSTDFTGYAVVVDSRDNFDIRKHNGSGGLREIIATTSVSISSGTWYDAEVEWHDGSGSEPDNEIVATLYDIDESEFGPSVSPSNYRVSELATIQVNDSSYPNNRAVGWGHLSSANLTAFGDFARKNGEV